jgi:micrococcal nuclease
MASNIESVRMRRRALLAVVLAAIGTATNTAPFAQRRSPPVLVQRVIDGNTVLIANVGRVRLLGITADRFNPRAPAASPWGHAAQQRLEGLISHRWVRLEFESDEAATHTSKAAYLFLDDGRFVNAWLVREGLARTRRRPVFRRTGELLEAEKEAKSSRRGLWGETVSAIASALALQ